MSFVKYLEDDENVNYVPREQLDTNATIGTKNRTREIQTKENILNQSLNEIFHKELPTYEDDYDLRQFKGLSNAEQISILSHILRIQAYSIRKAIDAKVSIVLPYLGRYVYNPYRELSLKIFDRLKDIENVESIKYIVRTTLGDLQRSERRDKRKARLSTRTESPIVDIKESGYKRDIIDERYNELNG